MSPGVRTPIPPEGIARAVRSVGIRAQLAAILALLIVEPGGIGRKRIGGGLSAERIAGAKGIRGRVRGIGISAQVPEILGLDGRRKETGKEQAEHPHRTPPGEGVA